MALDSNVVGGVSGNKQEVDATLNARVSTPGYNSAGVAVGGGDVNGQAEFSEIDAGTITGERRVLSGEVDNDYRARVAHDNLLDQHSFIDTAQDTGKFSHNFTTLTATSSTAGLLTNSGAITTTTTGMTYGTHAMFPCGGTQTLVIETRGGFTAQPNANQIIDFGAFQRGATTAFAPLDGVYFRLTSAGMFGVVNSNGTETVTSVFPLSGGTGTWVYTNNANNTFLIQAGNVNTTFWINNLMMASIPTPVGLGFPCMSRSLPWSIRHAIVGGAAGAALQFLVKDYRVLSRGVGFSDRLSVVGNRVLGSYQGLSGGTMGSLATLPNSANATAAVPTNTALVANLPGGLGGHGLVTAQATAVTDLIFGSYQVPAGSATVQGRRLVLRGALLDCLNTGAAVATTATIIEFKIAFGHTAVSMATADTASFATATTKAPRRLALGYQAWPIAAAIGASPTQGRLFLDLGDAPAYVNPGEFVALVGKFLIGTATASQTIQFMWQPVFSWE